jgi:hypothetical protein
LNRVVTFAIRSFGICDGAMVIAAGARPLPLDHNTSRQSGYHAWQLGDGLRAAGLG